MHEKLYSLCFCTSYLQNVSKILLTFLSNLAIIKFNYFCVITGSLALLGMWDGPAPIKRILLALVLITFRIGIDKLIERHVNKGGISMKDKVMKFKEIFFKAINHTTASYMLANP